MVDNLRTSMANAVMWVGLCLAACTVRSEPYVFSVDGPTGDGNGVDATIDAEPGLQFVRSFTGDDTTDSDNALDVATGDGVVVSGTNGGIDFGGGYRAGPYFLLKLSPGG